ncbi:MAG: SWIM zinc finger family protein [Lewinellaceae bacterium]|nr:SWIM zinc finger family protein [Lewinellaceae bacterium]MCB9286050.1 SWIM zinc finger family protein [Lewinellaceae bacterium]
MDWTYHKITAMAPNSLVLEKAKGLTSSRRWPETGASGSLFWGVCRSSGERTYHVVASLSDETFRCDCNSRYHPCRHILALLLFVNGNKAKPVSAELPPAWAQQLLKTLVHQGPSTEDRARSEAGRSRRFSQRLQLMQQGGQDLEEWLLDLARHGLSAIAEQPPGLWDSFAARMVDAKLGGVARRIRNFKSLAGREDGFELLLEEMAELYLLAQSFKQLESLPQGLQEEVLSQLGVNFKKEDVLAREGVADTWLAAGQVERESEDDNLRYRRTWFLGEKSSRLALILDFAWGRQGYETQWAVGSSVQGELVFYPGAYPLRALFRKQQPSGRPFEGKLGYASIDAFAQAYAQALADNPWLQPFPCLLAEVMPVQENGQFWLVDRQKQKLPLSSEGMARWNLLAVSGGGPLSVFGEWNGKALGPLSALANGRAYPLQGLADNPEEWYNDLFSS